MYIIQWRIQDLWKGGAGNLNSPPGLKKSLSGGGWGGGGGVSDTFFSPRNFFCRHLHYWVGVPSAYQTDLQGGKQQQQQQKRPKKIKIVRKKGGPRPIRPPPPWICHCYIITRPHYNRHYRYSFCFSLNHVHVQYMCYTTPESYAYILFIQYSNFLISNLFL